MESDDTSGEKVVPESNLHTDSHKKDLAHAISVLEHEGVLGVLHEVIGDHNTANPDQPAAIELGYERVNEAIYPVGVIRWGPIEESLGPGDVGVYNVASISYDTLTQRSKVKYAVDRGEKDTEWKSLDLSPQDEALPLKVKVVYAMRQAEQRALDR